MSSSLLVNDPSAVQQGSYTNASEQVNEPASGFLHRKISLITKVVAAVMARREECLGFRATLAPQKSLRRELALRLAIELIGGSGVL